MLDSLYEMCLVICYVCFSPNIMLCTMLSLPWSEEYCTKTFVICSDEVLHIHIMLLYSVWGVDAFLATLP